MTVPAFREPWFRRTARQASTIARAIPAGRRRARTATTAPDVDGAALRDLLRRAGAEAELVDVPPNRPPWTSTMLRIAAGEQLTWLAWGRVHLIKPLGIGVGPQIVLRGRIGDGPLLASSRDTLTATADRDGELLVASLFPGELQPDGSVATDRLPYRAMSGELHAVVARWPAGTSPAQALAAIADRDASGLVAAELRRLEDRPADPPGWAFHPLIGPTEIYAPADGGMQAETQAGVGIVRHPLDVPLTPSLRVRWSWRLDALASRLPEDTTLTHDYLSVALEFDDGRDLTWHWSAELPEGFAYRCPLEHWRHRETHVVARSGTDGLGRWVDEERPVLADHRAAIGGPPPGRVVSAWLIAVSLFQGGVAAGEIRGFELVDGDRVVAVL